MYRRNVLCVACVLAAPVLPVFAQNDRTAAEAAASGFLQKIDSSDLASLYRSTFSPRFKEMNSETTFVQNAGMLRIQTGGPAATRRLVGAQALNQIPGIPGQGDYYFVRHYAKFPVGAAFQDVYLEKVSGSWRVVGFWNSQAPVQ